MPAPDITPAPPSDPLEWDSKLVPRWFRRGAVTVILLVLTAQVGVWGFTRLASLWYTLAFAFFLGIAMEPVVNRLAARGYKRGVATTIVLGTLLLSIGLFFAAFGNLLITQLAQLANSVPDLLASATTWANEKFDTNLNANELLAQAGITQASLAQWAADLGMGLLGFVASAIGAVFSGFTMLLFAFYFAADGPNLRRTVASFLQPHQQRTFNKVWDISSEKAGGYVLSRGLMALISAIFHGIALMALGMPYWLAMGMWVGLVSQFVPTIGTYLAIILPVVIALANGNFITGVIIVVIGTVYQQIENYFISPRITKSTLQVHAAVAFGSVIVGGTLYGGTGALLAIPVVATIQSIIETYGRRYELQPDDDAPDAGAEQDASASPPGPAAG